MESEKLIEITLQTEKDERQRIAKDLHDSVQGDLNALRNYLKVLKPVYIDQSISELIAHAQRSLDKSILNVRNISNKLMSDQLLSEGFDYTLRDYLEQLSKLSGKKFTYRSNITELFIPTEVSYELFRIVQEFCQNMVKHGDIKEAFIVFYALPKGFFVEIVDDGIPFVFTNAFAESKGCGLHNIQSRIKSINGTLIQREVSVGNHFEIHLHEIYDTSCFS